MTLLEVQSIDGSFVPRRSAVASVELDGETVLAGGRRHGVFYRLDPVASLVWSCFDGSGTAEEIALDLAAELQAPPDAVVDDVVALSRTLGGLCFLEGVSCDAARPREVQSITLADEPAPRAPRRVVEPPSG